MNLLRISLVVACAASSAVAENWPTFRGPLNNGSTSETGLPTSWSTTENVAWSIDLPGPGSATPIIWGDRVFISTTDSKTESLKAMCFDRRTGEKLWEDHVANGTGRDYRSTFAAPSPATDGKSVFFFYGSGELVAYTLDGQRKWEKNIGPFAFGWTFSTSPVVHNGRLYMQVLQRDVAVKGRGKPTGNESYILALNPETGKQLWKQIRPSKAVAESLEAFSTPVVDEASNQLLVSGGDAITGHDLETGKEIWRWGTWNHERVGHWRLVPSPVAGGGVILACAPKGAPIYAVKAGQHGNLSDAALAWVSPKNSDVTSDVPTPAFYDGDFFVLCKKKSSLSRVDPKTGEAKWTVSNSELGRVQYEASPTVADGKVYVINFDGNVTVVNADDGGVISSVRMESNLDNEFKVRSSVVAAHGQLFIRTIGKLYCIGNADRRTASK